MTEDNQMAFYHLLDFYNDGNEPLENWMTEDLTQLANIIDAELRSREPNFGC